MMNLERNPNFLKNKYNLHNTEEVRSASLRTEKRTGEKVPQKPEAQIQNYLDRFQEIINRPDENKRAQGLEALKKVLHNNLVIKPEDIPENYFKNQQRLAREQGWGDIEIDDEQKKQRIEIIIADQKSSLDNWVDYLSSEDALYPDWLKYYAFRSISQLGRYNKEKKEFAKRTKNTTEPFPDINREALAYVLDEIVNKYQSQIKPKEALELRYQKIDKDETLTAKGKESRKAEQAQFQEFLNNENFAKLYAFAIDKVAPISKERLENIEGKWVKYDKGSDYLPLIKSLQGHGTGWCTTGELTAKTQLQEGDFYVYYSNDEKNNPNIPRVAIRMSENNISEIRGVAPNQNLDQYISPVVDKKLAEFGHEGERYKKKSSDMKILTDIDNRFKKGEELTENDLRFLYQVDSRIEGFGYKKDPRIEEILNERNKREDLFNLFNCRPEQISFTEEEALSGNIVFHHGDLSPKKITSAEGLKLPNSISGNLNLRNLKSAEGLKLPNSISGNLNLRNLKSAEGLTLSKYIGGNLNLCNLTSAEGLTFPDSIDGNIDLDSLTSAEGLTFPDSIGGDLVLRNLTSAEGLKLPNSINRDLDFRNLFSAEGLTFPNSIGGNLYLHNLDLDSLKSTKGLTLPNFIGGKLYLRDGEHTLEDLHKLMN